jgi:hypothetical protein
MVPAPLEGHPANPDREAPGAQMVFQLGQAIRAAQVLQVVKLYMQARRKKHLLLHEPPLPMEQVLDTLVVGLPELEDMQEQHRGIPEFAAQLGAAEVEELVQDRTVSQSESGSLPPIPPDPEA